MAQDSISPVKSSQSLESSQLDDIQSKLGLSNEQRDTVGKIADQTKDPAAFLGQLEKLLDKQEAGGDTQGGGKPNDMMSMLMQMIMQLLQKMGEMGKGLEDMLKGNGQEQANSNPTAA